GTIAPLFSGGLVRITLLLWLCFMITLMAHYFLSSWMPVLFEAKGESATNAAMISTMYHLGGMLGGLVMSLVLDRFGFLAVAVFLALGCPAVLTIGISGLSPFLLGMVSALAGFAVLGAQFGANAAAGLIYPTSV